MLRILGQWKKGHSPKCILKIVGYLELGFERLITKEMYVKDMPAVQNGVLGAATAQYAFLQLLET